MRNSSSPTTTVTGAIPGFTSVRTAMTAACHAARVDAESSVRLGDRFAAEPDAAGLQAEGPGEGALVIGVPEDHVGEPAPHHPTAVGGAPRLRAAAGGGPA